MKRFLLFAFATFTSALLFSALGANAAPPPNIKIYYSEPIGVGERVYQITSCLKEAKYVPLRCSDEVLGVFGSTRLAQCFNLKGEVIPGKIVKGCKKEDKPETPYPDYDAEMYEQKKCEEPDDQGTVYVKEFIILESKDESGRTVPKGQEVVKGRIGWPKGPDKNVIATFYGGDTSLVDARGVIVEESYQPTLCRTWDVLEADKSNVSGPFDALGPISDRVEQSQSNEMIEAGEKLIKAGCNNDNSRETPPYEQNPPYTHCSVRERIVGTSGVEILAKYVGGIYRWAAGTIGIVSVLTIVYSGVQISTSGSDSGKMDAAKGRIMQSLIGLAILFLSGLILFTINPGFFTG